MSIHVHLERFEGPLGLLLHLIREQEMDIFNININQITKQYLDYIKAMRRLDLEVAGEFIAMAATLIHIKSRMLLPQYNEEGEEIQEDPRKELVQKLLEYKKIKELSVDLYKQPLLNRDVFARGYRTDVESLEEGELVLEEKPLFSLIAAFRHAMKNMKKTWHRVLGEVQSISVRILEIKDLLVVGKRIVFGDLVTDRSKEAGQVLVTFLALLELSKMGFVSLFQSAPFADIHIETKKPVDRDVITQVESYDAVNAEQKAAEIFDQAQLSLDEAVMEPASEPDPEKPVAEETFADAATDEEIAAEEAALFGITAPVAAISEQSAEPSQALEEQVTSEVMEGMPNIPSEEPVIEAAAAEPEADSVRTELSEEPIPNPMEEIAANTDEVSVHTENEPPLDFENHIIVAASTDSPPETVVEAAPESTPAPAEESVRTEQTEEKSESVSLAAARAAADFAFLTAPDTKNDPEAET